MSFAGDMKAKMQARKAELEAELKDIDKSLKQPHSQDTEERAIETEGDEVLESLGKVHQHELREIEGALERIELGTYGQCTSCGEPIDEKRLEALPYTHSCIACAG